MPLWLRVEISVDESAFVCLGLVLMLTAMVKVKKFLFDGLQYEQEQISDGLESRGDNGDGRVGLQRGRESERSC